VSAARATALGRAAIGIDARQNAAPELLVARLATGDRLVWQVELLTDEPARWQLLIDAISGRIVDRRNILMFAGRDRRTYSANNADVLPGTLVRAEGDPPSGDRHADAAHDHAGRVYDYYRNTFGRDSFDGEGRTIESTVHYRANPAVPYNNAFWDGSQLVYGDGDGELFGPLGMALDVVAHELTHGVTAYTAGLIYSEQSGALNEAFSDVFGALVDDANWEIAEAVFTPPIPGDALRSMADPLLYGQPSVWSEYLELPDNAAGDYGGVHANSGIINQVAYRIAQQLGRPKLGQIFYRTLTMKLTSTSDFLDMRDATVQSCDELIGTNGITASDCQFVEAAFATAGIVDPPPPPEELDQRVFLPLVTGSSPSLQCGTNLVRNPGFEERGAWAYWSGVLGTWDIQTEGTRSARLNSADQLVQVVTLPNNGDGLTLSFDALRPKNTSNDQVGVRIEDPVTHELLTPEKKADQGLEEDVWKRVSIPLDDLAGISQVRLLFKHITPGGVFYIDNVRLTMDCAAP
jgi:hypothetical protein